MSKVLKKLKQGHNYKYTELSQINEYCEENDIDYYQTVDVLNGCDYIMTYLKFKASEDGSKWEEPRRGCQVVDAVLVGVKNPAQEQGSAITYARRYSLLMALGLATEDNDAATFTKPVSAKIAHTASTTKPPSDAQLKMIRILGKKNGLDETVVNTRLAQIKTSAEASAAIQKLQGAGDE